jgi:putative membrane protein
MKKLLIFSLLILGLLVAGCSNTNKAATSDNPSQPSSADNSSSSAAAPSSSSNTETGNTNKESSLSSSDQHFIMEAAKGNKAEVELGQVVAQKATNPQVKRFAEMMVKDHTQALNQLQQLAEKKKVTLPSELPDDAKDLESKINSASGSNLDKTYMDGMVDDHQKDVQEFKDAAKDAQDNDVKQWASSTLPTLQQHLQKAKQIDAKLDGGKSSGKAPSGE